MGLENVIKFVVGLSASHGQKVCTLFGIKQQRVRYENLNFSQSVYSYQMELVQECTDHVIKSAMVEALLSAPVITVDARQGIHFVNNIRAEQLLEVLTDEQSHQFLARAYDCKIKKNSCGQATTFVRDANSDWPIVWDSYVIGCLQKFSCTALEMGCRMLVVDSDIPVDILPLLASGVSEQLYIDRCTLLYGKGNARHGDVLNIRQTASPKVLVSLRSVRGRQPFGGCGGMAPNVGRLELFKCGDIDISGLTQTFTQLGELHVAQCRLVYTADFRQLDTMKKLYLADCGEVKPCQLAQMFPQLTSLLIHVCSGCQVSWSDVHSEWLSLRKLWLFDCDEVRLSQWRLPCPHLESLHVQGTSWSTGGSAVCMDGVDSQWPSLQKLLLFESHLVKGGRRLTVEEATQTLTDIWPSAIIDIFAYKEW